MSIYNHVVYIANRYRRKKTLSFHFIDRILEFQYYLNSRSRGRSETFTRCTPIYLLHNGFENLL